MAGGFACIVAFEGRALCERPQRPRRPARPPRPCHTCGVCAAKAGARRRAPCMRPTPAPGTSCDNRFCHEDVLIRWQGVDEMTGQRWQDEWCARTESRARARPNAHRVASCRQSVCTLVGDWDHDISIVRRMVIAERRAGHVGEAAADEGRAAAADVDSEPEGGGRAAGAAAEGQATATDVDSSSEAEGDDADKDGSPGGGATTMGTASRSGGPGNAVALPTLSFCRMRARIRAARRPPARGVPTWTGGIGSRRWKWSWLENPRAGAERRLRGH